MNKDMPGILCLHIPMLPKWKVVIERGVQPLLLHQIKNFTTIQCFHNGNKITAGAAL